MSRRAMICLGLTAVVVLAACTPVPPSELPPMPPESGIRVMTFNLLGAQGDADIISEHAGWAARIDQLRPDVLVLQEAQSDDVAAIVGLTTSDYSVASYLHWACDLKAEREGVAILVRSTISTIGAGGTHVGESCFDPTMKRVLVWADLDIEGGPFRVYGTHLTAGGSASGESRNAQIRRIRQVVAAEDITDERRWVLAGDINAAPGSYSYGLMTGDVAEEADPYRLVDTFAERSPDAADPTVCPVVASSDARGMQFLLDNPDHVRRCGYTAGWPKDDNWLLCEVLSLCVSWEQRRDLSVRERIDVVLRPLGGPVAVAGAYVPNRSDDDWAAPGAEWYRLSDHLPAVVDLEIDPVAMG